MDNRKAFALIVLAFIIGTLLGTGQTYLLLQPKQAAVFTNLFAPKPTPTIVSPLQKPTATPTPSDTPTPTMVPPTPTDTPIPYVPPVIRHRIPTPTPTDTLYNSGN